MPLRDVTPSATLPLALSRSLTAERRGVDSLHISSSHGWKLTWKKCTLCQPRRGVGRSRQWVALFPGVAGVRSSVWPFAVGVLRWQDGGDMREWEVHINGDLYDAFCQPIRLITL